MQAEMKQSQTRCAIYTRVSTDLQAEVKFNSCEAQEEKIKAFITSQNDFELIKAYSDPGYTGANLERPGITQLFSDIKDGLIDVVLTYKIDRLTRSPKDFYQLIEFLEKYNVSYISVTERFDTSTPSGGLLRNIMLTFAQFERELTSERIRDKNHQRVLKGLPTGGYAPFGYKWENKKFVIHKENAETAKFIFNTYIQTQSLQQTTRALREKSILQKSGRPYGNFFVYDLVRNPVLTGKIRHKDKIYPGQHTAIISEDTFKYAQTIHKQVKALRA